LAQPEKPSGNVSGQSLCNFAVRCAAEVVFMKQIQIYGHLLKEMTDKVLREALVSFV